MTAGHNEPVPAVPPPDLSLFLSAGIGVERSGMTLTVLSALARLDLDPWDEAGRLFKLSRAKAAESFADSLAMLPAMPGWPRGTAARLVALLPRDGSVRPAPAREPATFSQRAVRQRAALMALLVVAVVLALGIVGHWAAADVGAAARWHGLVSGPAARRAGLTPSSRIGQPGRGRSLLHRRLLPFASAPSPRVADRNPPVMNLAPPALLAGLAAEHLHAQLCNAALHAFAAENEARMETMAAARTQVERQLSSLQARQRMVRQEEITAEIIELAAGEAASLGRASA